MSDNYGNQLKVSAGTAIKIGFFGASGVTLFSLILSVLGLVIVLVLGLLGVSAANMFRTR